METKQKICKNCGSKFTPYTSLMVTCSKRCYYQYIDKKREEQTGYRKPIRQISEKKKQRIKENGSEAQLFKEIWEEREHYCKICGSYISEPKAECFSHILGKGRYPSLRYNKKNIVIVCSEKCHKEHDRQNAGNDLVIIQEILGNTK